MVNRATAPLAETITVTGNGCPSDYSLGPVCLLNLTPALRCKKVGIGIVPDLITLRPLSPLAH